MSKKLAIIGILVLGLGAAACKKKAGGGNAPATGPLGPVVEVTNKLQKGIDAFIGGTDVAKAFAPFSAKARSRVAARLQEKKVKSAQLMGMEFELLYYKGSEPVYYLRTFVHPGADGPAFLSFRGREPSLDRRTKKRRLYVRGNPISAYTGQTASLGKAAKSLLDVLKAGKCSDLKVADLSGLAAKLPERMKRRMQRGKERTQRSLNEQCPKLGKLGADRIELRIDDFSALGFDGAGKAVGLIRGDVRLRAGGNLEVRIGRFRPFP